MQPAQIRDLLKARWPFVAGAAVALAVAGVIFASSGQSKPQTARAAVPVAVAPTERRDLAHMSEVAGTVESLHSVIIRPQVDGILTEILFNEGDQVDVGQVLATIDDRGLQAALAAAKGDLASSSAQLRAAEQDLARSQELVARGAVSRQVLDKQTASVDQLRAAVQVSQAKVKTADVNLSYTRIASPVKGRVGIRRVDAGNLVRANEVAGLVTVAQIDPISVVFPVPQSILAGLRADVEQPGGGLVEAFDRMTNQVLARGHITAFDNTVDATTGTAKIRAELDNKTEKLSPGQFVAVRMRIGVSANALVVPAVAVRPGLEGSYVFRIANNVAERVTVSVGYTNDSYAVITQGLNDGDMVVVDGMSRLTQGTAVNVRETKAKSAAVEPGAAGAVQGMQ